MYSFKLFEFNNEEKIDTNWPIARSGHRLVCDSDHNLILLGGYNNHVSQIPTNARVIQVDGHYVFPELWQFHIADNQWKYQKEISSGLPDGVCASGCAIVYRPGNVLIYGGTGFPFGDSMVDNPYSISIEEKAVTKLPLNSAYRAMPVYGNAIILYKDDLYTFGGTTGTDFFLDVNKFNLKSNTWLQVYMHDRDSVTTQRPSPRYRHEAIHDGDDLVYIFGGCSDLELYGFMSIPAFNLKTNKWEWKSTKGDPNINSFAYPRARKFNSCVHFRDEYNNIIVCIFGGCFKNNTSLDDLWKLNLTTLQWTKVQYSSKNCGNLKVYFHSAAVTTYGRMFVFGGVSGKGPNLKRHNNLYSIWLQIPKLSEICWQALRHYAPSQLKVSNFENLKKFGIPSQFLLRL